MFFYYLYKSSVFIHILCGVAALVTVFIPFATSKGSKAHRNIGRYFVNAMLGVGWTGLIMAICMMTVAEQVFYDRPVDPSTDFVALEQQTFALGMFFLTLVTLVIISARFGMKVIKVKANRTQFRTPSYTIELATLAIVSVPCFYYGWVHNQVVYMVFAGLSLQLSFSYMRYAYKKNILNNEWLVQHMSALTTTAIACITAFVVTGADRLLGLEAVSGQLRLMTWVAPGVIGTAFIVWGQFYYRKKFNVQSQGDKKTEISSRFKSLS